MTPEAATKKLNQAGYHCRLFPTQIMAFHTKFFADDNFSIVNGEVDEDKVDAAIEGSASPKVLARSDPKANRPAPEFRRAVTVDERP